MSDGQEWDAEQLRRHEEVLRTQQQAWLDVLDLNDPRVENAVAAAIVRLAPEGAYVPLSERYPWRFHEPTAGRQRVTLLDAVVEALRGSASVHDAERIPHLSAALRALADSLVSGAIAAIRYENLLEQIEAIWGTTRVDDALRLAVEAGKYALTLEQVGQYSREHAYLELASAVPADGEGFVAWAKRLGLITQKQLDEGAALDLLGMRSEAEEEES